MNPIRSRACASILALAAAAAAAAGAGPSPFAPARLRARLRNRHVRESSGLAASRANPGLCWTHNDSGNEAALYAFDGDGTDVTRFPVDGARNVDWEDMAAFTVDGAHYLAIADTGDRPDVPGGPPPARSDCTVYVVEEPHLDRGRVDAAARAKLATAIAFAYEDGPRDCESMAVDVRGASIYLMAKTLSFRSEVYRLPLRVDDRKRGRQTARIVARSRVALATAMDISPDGRRAAVLTYLGIALFERADGRTWPDTFARAPTWVRIPLVPLAEAVAFGHDGRTLLFTCELAAGDRNGAPLYVLPPAAHAEEPPLPTTP